ncbi:Hypothetical predicted protein [Marmota monax]|uniref:Uncharacterized protein n=1 Tax=Marmota monax TaxID=9995 RepID=A0A5E4CWU4_MARMO|nr:Hypothetical predicted protein [Marmota monax]
MEFLGTRRYVANQGEFQWGMLVVTALRGYLGQVIVQRSLSARNLNHAKAGSILASYLKMLPMGLMIMPGMISRALFPGRKALVLSQGCRALGVLRLHPTEAIRRKGKGGT